MSAARTFSHGRAALGLALCIAAGVGSAQTATRPAGATSTAPRQGDADPGAAVANRGVTNVPACASCHGGAGEGNAQAGFPRLSGQPASYLAKQLDAYADGRRPNPVMTPIATALSPAQRGAVAAHYAALAVAGPAGAEGVTSQANTANTANKANLANPANPANPASAANAPSAASAAATGRVLALQGDEARVVQACRNCHGPDGVGESNGYPALAGQHASYLLAAMKAWQDGSRKTDPTGSMPHIAQALAPAELQAVVAYYSGLPPAVAVDQRAMPSPAMASNRPTIVSGPVRRAPAGGPGGTGTGPEANPGTGTEHGGPVTGGSQGPGGTPPNTGSGNPASGAR